MKYLFSQENILGSVREIIWWLLTACITYAILYPISSKLYYLYIEIHAAFIFVTLTYFRWSISFRSLLFLRPAWVRFLFFTANLVLFVYFMQYEYKLIAKIDNFFMEDFGFPKTIMYEDVRQELFSYISNTILLFGTGSLITIIAFQLRLIVSYWQYYKHQASRMLED